MSEHECTRLADCLDHPRWHVLAPWPPGEPWVIYPPNQLAYFTVPADQAHGTVLGATQSLADAYAIDRKEP